MKRRHPYKTKCDRAALYSYRSVLMHVVSRRVHGGQNKRESTVHKLDTHGTATFQQRPWPRAAHIQNLAPTPASPLSPGAHAALCSGPGLMLLMLLFSDVFQTTSCKPDVV